MILKQIEGPNLQRATFVRFNFQ
uniref:Uncharacterized protein n=1 Tax=Arundo donax TaxID=35708 RepID=A0A0A9AL56_ARUDO